MKKREYKVLSSNYRAIKKSGRTMTNRDYPVWSDSEDSYEYLISDFVLCSVFGGRLEFIGGRNISTKQESKKTTQNNENNLGATRIS